MSLIERIQTPADVKKLSVDELVALAAECRQKIFDSVSRNGGHLASNLGVAELTLALHYVYDFGPFPQGPDRLVFDVGHQCYVHKMLTGRTGLFENLRKKGSVSGFPLPEESPYDLFAVGHAGTAISTAVGLARGDAMLGRKNHVVAVVGDASIVNGMAFEGLNAAGTLRRQMIIVLNDNGMSISRPQGAMAAYLERVRISTTYQEAKSFAHKLLDNLPHTVGSTIENMLYHLKEGVKTGLWPGQVFESMNLKYMGPIDGHDLPGLIQTLGEIKEFDHPILLHVKTVKGKGYEAASDEPTKFHSPAGFHMNGGQLELKKSGGKSWTTAFADACIKLAETDKRVVTLTAAMPDGTGLSKFENTFPNRFYDTGICESHLAGMAAGMCKAGLRPIAAIYSTFIQRAFDQIWQEVALNGLPVIFAMDRAGYVGDDGPVHHGFMDQAFLRPLPGMVLMAPSDECELNRALRLALTLDTPSAVRYPRDAVPPANFHEIIDEPLRQQASGEWELARSRVLLEGRDAVILCYGALAANALAAADELAGEGLSIGVVDARFCKPVDGKMIERAIAGGSAILTLEDHSLQNGFGSAVLEYAVSKSLPTGRITRLGMPDRLIAHATRQQQLTEVGLDAAGIARSVRDAVRKIPVAAQRSAV